MSSAILYVAIVAIWAVVLVPRWLRGRPAPPQPVPVPVKDADAGRQDPAPGPSAATAWTVSARGQDTEGKQAPDGEAADAPTEDRREPREPEAVPSPVSRRLEVVKARRRMLTTLIALTVMAVALAVTRLGAYWMVIPPVVLLSGYLLLLRSFTRFDAERAHRAARTSHSARLRADQETALPQVPAAGPDYESVPGAPAASGDAEIIDISGRIGDQVYDQYSDAANWAVGD